MKTRRILLLALLLVGGERRQAAAQGTAFTYQGQLFANGVPATGIYDLRFAVFDSAGATNQIANALTNLATPVTAGLFIATLDFGTGVFTGPGRWLEVGVRSNASANFILLSPLQPVNPAPYAIAAGNLVGVLPVSQLPATVVTNNQANLNLSGNISGNISGNGSGLTNMPGTVVWQAPSVTRLQALPNAGYLLTNTLLVTLTLPASPNVGDVLQVAEVGSGGWILAQNTGQAITGSFIPLWAGFGAPTTKWSAIASSSSGAKLAAVVYFGGIYTSDNSGTSWRQQPNAPYTNWQSIVSSSDGTQLAAVVYPGGIYTSSNSGTNWTQQPGAPNERWQTIASSSDGTQLAAAVEFGGIYTSSNSGTNWAQQPAAPDEEWQSIASSSDGTHLAAVVYFGGIYTSTNSGINWTQQTSAPNEEWQSVASSSDGTRLAAVAYPGGIYTSSDSGATWTAQPGAPNEDWQSIASSTDGTQLAAAVNLGGIYTSTNSGTNWTEQAGAPNQDWQAVASSSDGTQLAAVVYPGGIYTSSNSGTNWTLQAGAPLASSSSATTVGATGFLQGLAGASIELIYAGGGIFVAVTMLGTVYDN